MSRESSVALGRNENSCSTPSTLTHVGAAPSIEDRSTRRKALPTVRAKPGSNGSTTKTPWSGWISCHSCLRGSWIAVVMQPPPGHTGGVRTNGHYSEGSCSGEVPHLPERVQIDRGTRTP